MMGVRFVTVEDFSIVLDKTIAILGTADYVFHIDGLWVDGEGSDAFPDMEEKPYAWDALRAPFDHLGRAFVYFARIRRYAPGANILPMETLEDYDVSPCSLILLCVDMREFEIYAKDEKEVRRLYDACSAAGFGELELQTDENFGRTGMSY